MTARFSTYMLALMLVLVLTSRAMATTALNKQPYTERSTTPVELSGDVNRLVFTGTVKKIPDGTALVTSTATYLLAGGNFEMIVGKEVNVIGRVVKDGSLETIQVARTQITRE